jgi:hypothetical protein
MPRTLSTSDFKAARDCPTKLYYKELDYPTTSDHDPYLHLLSDGRYMVEKIAKLQYPNGIEIDHTGIGTAGAVAQTTTLLRSADRIVLFEAMLASGAKLARVPILVKRGNEFDVLAVKAKLWKGAAPGCEPFRGKHGAIEPRWKRYLHDVTFQTMVLQDLFLDASIHPYLVMCDQAKTTPIDSLHSQFTIRRLTVGGSPTGRIEVEFLGDADALRRDNFLAVVPVGGEVRELMPAIREASDRFADSVAPALVKITSPLSVGCKSCEYRGNETDERDGFLECWGSLGRVEPNVLELYHLGSPCGATSAVSGLIAAQTMSLLDLDDASLANQHGKLGAYGTRQQIQRDCARSGKEWVSPGLGAILDALAYPLHFVDFETSQLAIPYHSRMHPYGMVAFQWSCHTIREPNGPVEHREWLNNEDAFPNFEFARSLRDAVVGGGSVLTWATHESTSLARIRLAMDEWQHDDPALADWIDALRAGRAGCMVDLNAIAVAHYCHPMMKGSTSIKYVLPAVWAEDAEVRARFPEYGAGLTSPYAALPDIEIGGRPVRVDEGTEAMRAYQEMMYGAGRLDPDFKARYAALLRQYCKLDTAAMVMIWDHWRRVSH